MVPAPETGNIVLIANPVAKSGQGAVAADEAMRLLWSRVGEDRVQVLYTARPRHATELAAQLGPDVGCVIALGGDGLINEVAAGLMERPASERPALAVIPVGSGNDYAATLGMAYSVVPAIGQILRFRTMRADVGCVNGRHFVETLSFGLDAAIALDTMERRKRSGRAGTMLYLESAVDQLFNHLDTYRFKLAITDPAEGGEPQVIEDEAYLVAAQIGPTYGGHFCITPQASIEDGLLDLCWATPKLIPMRALAILLRARAGKHTGSSHIHFAQAKKIELDFEKEPPAQIDGEKITGTHFSIECIPDALTVVVGEPRG